MRVSRTGIDEIKRRNDLCEVVIEHGIELKKRGRSYFGLCPFHQEKTGSFAVSREAGLFHCFGCGVGGDVIGFMVRFHGVSFPDAMRQLAARASIQLDTLMESSATPQAQAARRDFTHRIETSRFDRFTSGGGRP